MSVMTWAQVAPLHVEGRYFKDDAGNIVNLHGFAQTFSPWFNERGTKWSNYDVTACLNYNKGIKIVNFTYQLPKDIRLKYGLQDFGGYRIALDLPSDYKITTKQ